MAQLINSLLLLLLFSYLFPSAKAIYDIMSFGARPDGRTDSSKAILNAWTSACASNEPATLYVPAGSFAVGHVTFSGPCRSSKIDVQIDGSLVAPSNYASFGTNADWIVFEHVEGVSVYGGMIDGRGTGLWACKASRGSCPDGARSLTFLNSKDIKISNLTSINSELYHIVIENCQGATVQGVKISAPGNSPNTDGVHVQMSTDVTITSTSIGTGDDCISVGPGTTNLWIDHVTCGPGHGISIGSLGKGNEEAGVQNVTVQWTKFTGTQNGLRIKTWGRPSDGFVKGVTFDHAVMQNVQNPIIIDQNYCPDGKGCPDKNSGVKISDISYSDIQGSSATQVAVNFDCSATNPCSGIELQDIKLTYENKPAESFCKNAGGDVSGFIIPPSCL